MSRLHGLIISDYLVPFPKDDILLFLSEAFSRNNINSSVAYVYEIT